ncbi:MAG: response regulator [Symploca sp. SIO2G7]|nr:response regulator [Symploca sp. SIO2G7]
MENKETSLLLVDDDEVSIIAVKKALEQNHITNPLYIATNGLEALEMLRGNTMSKLIPGERKLVLLDLNMPKMGGIEFLREVRADPNLRGIPVIVLTTSNEDLDIVEAYKLNVAGYIIKPVKFEKFVEAIGTLNKYWMLSEMP